MVVAGSVAAISTLVFLVSLIRFGGLSADIPNQRSSHSHTTPRGGGLGFGLGTFGGLFFQRGILESNQTIAAITLFAALTILFLGVYEDRRGLGPKYRLFFELAIAVVFSHQVQRWSCSDFGLPTGALPDFVMLGMTALWISWTVNYFNFMDGINGIACFQAIAALGTFAAIAFVNSQTEIFGTMICVIIALLVFLPMNFPKSRIFMGDSGSLFLGFLVAAVPLWMNSSIAVAGSKVVRVGFIESILPLAPFLLDSSITLLFRIGAKEKVSNAHNSHVYQQWARSLGSHAPVAIAYFFLAAIGGALSYCMTFYGSGVIVVLAVTYLSGLAAVFSLIQARHFSRKHPKYDGSPII